MYTTSDKKQNTGFVAVITAIVVTLIITLIAMVTSTTSYLGRVDTTRIESKSMSRQIAEACLEHARVKLAVGVYTGNEAIAIDSYQCTLDPIIVSGANKILTSKATVDNKTTKLELTILATTLETVTFKEL
ncbi:MAG: hypothetical protein RL641_376 [Candidatus Parcubacteria bacterium]|jgi:Tfp pilus assembly protein PilX